MADSRVVPQICARVDQSTRETPERRLFEQRHPMAELQPQRLGCISIGRSSMDHDHGQPGRIQRLEHGSKPLSRPLLRSSTGAGMDDEHRRAPVPSCMLELPSTLVGH